MEAGATYAELLEDGAMYAGAEDATGAATGVWAGMELAIADVAATELATEGCS